MMNLQELAQLCNKCAKARQFLIWCDKCKKFYCSRCFKEYEVMRVTEQHSHSYGELLRQ